MGVGGAEEFREVTTGVGGLDPGHLFRGAFGDDPAPAGAAFRAEIKEPVRLGDEVEIVFDDDDGVAGIDEALEDFDQTADVLEVQADGGFFEDEQVVSDGAATGATGGFGFGAGPEPGEEMGDEFDALGFPSAEGGTGLAEAEVIEAGIAQGFEWAEQSGVG